jgi:four helix bundle protein
MGVDMQTERPKAKTCMNIAENSLEESRYYLIPAQDLGYGTSEERMKLLEEVSRLLNAYARAILASGSGLLASMSRRFCRDIKGAALG